AAVDAGKTATGAPERQGFSGKLGGEVVLPDGVDTVSFLRNELARLKGLNPFQILNLPTDSGSEAIRGAFLKATKQFHPVRFARERAEPRTLANEISLFVPRASSQLGDEERRRALRGRIERDEHTPTPQPIEAPPPRAAAPPPPPPAFGRRNPDEVRA